MEADQQRRDRWDDAHADTLAYRTQLAADVAARRTELGQRALSDRPRHLLDLVGPVPTDPSKRREWVQLASRIEAYREEWRVEPGELAHPPMDGVEARAWNASIGVAKRLAQLDRHQGRGASIERGIER